MTSQIVRLDRVQVGLVASVRDAIPSAVVAMAGEEIPDGIAGDVLAIVSLTSGFDAFPRGGACRPVRELPTAATVQITAPARVWISGIWWDVDDRDDLLARLAAEPLVSVDAAASGADAVQVEASEAGDLYGLDATAGATWTVDASEQVEALIDTVTGSVAIDFYARARGLRNGAASHMQRWRARVQTTPGRELLDRYGLALGGAPIRSLPLDALAGPRWSSRARAVFDLTTIALDVTTTIPPIETAVATVEAHAVGPSQSDPPVEFEITIEIP